jgi:CRISPR-associated exonuclease Cas4
LPIEYKRGRPKKNDCDRVQLCAQALCLEEMLEARIDRGILFYGKHRRRTEVVIDDVLREKTVSAAARLHALIRSEKTPRAVPEPKCESCSLKSLCLPVGTGPSRSATRFVNRQFNSVLRSTGPTTTFMEDL